MLSIDDVIPTAEMLLSLAKSDEKRLNKISQYLNGDPNIVWLPANAPRELQAIAKISQVNMMDLAVKSTTQNLFVDGYASNDPGNSSDIWSVWQRNRWDRKQLGLYRATTAYGAAYGVVMPGNPVPVIRPVSPQNMTTVYGFDTDWPEYALEDRGRGYWRLYDDENVYQLVKLVTPEDRNGTKIHFRLEGIEQHGQGVCPVVRYLATDDLDTPVVGDVEKLFNLQDQINVTTFSLMTVQHYGANGHKIIVGSMVSELEKALRMSAGTVTTVNAEPGDLAIHDIPQTPITPFIESRNESIKELALISQTPVHELLGNLANLSAAALVEVRNSQERKLSERKTVIGESHEQLLGQAGELMGIPADYSARVRWRPNRDSGLFELVRALGDMAERLGVPAESLWSELPFSDDAIDMWREIKSGGTTAEAVEGAPNPVDSGLEDVDLSDSGE